MKPTIEPYQYYFIKNQVKQLLGAYSAVNDPQTIETLEGLTSEKITGLFTPVPECIHDFLTNIFTIQLTKEKAERYLLDLKEQVTPFKQPTVPQLTKVFRKTKKLKIPHWSSLDLRDYTYYGWNDAGSQKKFITLYQAGKLQGVSGHLEPEILKGICSICHKTSAVSLFLSTTKSAGDGTYTKRGNYICHDSERCNHQLHARADLDAFVTLVKEK
jgi:hypothetical protein